MVVKILLAVTHMRLNRKAAALRRALMQVKPEYYSWSVEAQERYRVNLPEDEAFRIEQVVVKSLFDMTLETEAQLDAARDEFTDAQYLQLNATLLPLQGIGDDYFFLNESFGDKTILDFPTLYDYDYDDYCFQEQAHVAEDPQHTAKPYRGNLYAHWARLFVDGTFSYATLFTAASYIFSEINDLGSGIVQELIPHEYFFEEHHVRLDAGGHEAQLDELQRRYVAYVGERYDALLTDFDAAAERKVYILDESTDDEPQIDIVFTDKTALQAVRLQHFLRDCRQIVSGDFDDLTTQIKQELRACRRYLDQSYQDILKNFEPKVG